MYINSSILNMLIEKAYVIKVMVNVNYYLA